MKKVASVLVGTPDLAKLLTDEKEFRETLQKGGSGRQLASRARDLSAIQGESQPKPGACGQAAAVAGHLGQAAARRDNLTACRVRQKELNAEISELRQKFNGRFARRVVASAFWSTPRISLTVRPPFGRSTKWQAGEYSPWRNVPSHPRWSSKCHLWHYARPGKQPAKSKTGILTSRATHPGPQNTLPLIQVEVGGLGKACLVLA
jgi:hypothetical protein